MKVACLSFDKVIGITCLLLIVLAILNPYHLYPGFDLFPNLIICVVLAFGLSIAFLLSKEELKLNKGAVTWLVLIVLLGIQPLINIIDYPDSLINPVASLILVLLLSISIMTVKDKNYLLKIVEISLISCMSISLGMQVLQLFGYSWSSNNIIFLLERNRRFDANFSQPNQAAFMFCLAQIGCLYLYELKNKKVWVVIAAFFALGIALTSSRAGFIISSLVVFLFYTFKYMDLKKKLLSILRFFSLNTMFYILGIFVYKEIKSDIDTSNAVARFTNGSLYARESLQHQAYLIFTNNSLNGIGWGNFAKGGIKYHTELTWFAFSEHSHFFLTQVASELGLLGIITLIPLAYVLIRKFSFQMNLFEATCYTSIIAFILYSCSEFPLWYLKYLLIFALFFALIEDDFWSISHKLNKYLFLFSLSFFIAAIFYTNSFLSISKGFYAIKNKDISSKEIKVIYKNMPSTFGFLKFKEQFLFYNLPVNYDDLDKKLQIAERVVPSDLNRSSMFKYGQLLALNGQSDLAITAFTSSCMLEFNNDCRDIVNQLQVLSEQYPSVYSKYYTIVSEWERRQK